jgi:hypothetical protein
MGVRISDRPLGHNVIALHPMGTTPEPGCPDPAEADAPLPEPVQLYGLTMLAFLLHTPTPGRARQWCVRCGVVWPCDHLRLAYRLREGF